MKRRAWLWLLAIPAFLLSLLGGLGYWVLATESGLRETLALANRFSGGALQASLVSGRLIDRVDLKDLHLRTASGLNIGVDHLSMVWHPRELLRRSLHIESLNVENLRIAPGAAAADKKPPTAITLPARLPLDVRLDDVRLEGFRLDSSQSEPFTLDSISARASWIGDRLLVERLQTALPQTGPLSLSAEATMAASSIRFAHLDVQGPGALSAKGLLGLGDTASDLNLQWSSLHWPLVGDEPAEVADINGKLHFTGPLRDYRYTLHSEASAHKLPVVLDSNGSGDAKGLRLDALKLASGPSTVDAQGTLGWTPLAADLALNFAHLNPALIDAGMSGELNGSGHLRSLGSTTRDIGFDLQVANSTLRGYPFALNAQGQSDGRSASLETFEIKAADGSVSGKGRLAWTPALQADVDASLARLNPGVFVPRWSGSLNGRLHAESSTIDGAPAIAFGADLSHSTLRDYPLSLTAQGDWHAGVLRLSRFAAQTGASQLTLSGQLTPPLDLKAHFDSPQLAQVYPNLSGQLKFDLSAAGDLPLPRIVSAGSGKDIRYTNLHIAQLSWNADVDRLKSSKIGLDASGIDAGLLIDKANLAVSGTEAYHRMDIHADTERGRITVATQGGYDEARREWGGQLVALELLPASLPRWALEKPAGLLLGQDRLSLEPACIGGDGGRACFNVQRAVSSPGIQLAWNLDEVRLAAFQALLSKGSQLEGKIGGSGHLAWVDGDVGDADADLHLDDLRFSTSDAPALEMQPGSLKLSQQAGALHAQLVLDSNRGSASADIAAAPAASFGARALSGKLALNVPDLAFVQPFSRELIAVGGRLAGSFQLAGTIDQPRLGGQLDLSEGHAKLATPGIDLEDIAMHLSGNGEGPLALNGTMRSDTGTLTVAGSVDPATAPPKVELSLKGANFLAASTPDAQAWVSPDLSFLADAEGMHLSGTLTVPKARITPHGFGDSGVSTSSDQIIVGDEAPESAAPSRPVFANMRIDLGDDVRFEGMGLKTRISGGVAIVEEPQRAARAQGELRLVDGKYKAYGQDLSIDDGRLLFDGGAVTSPAVDIRAYRKPAADIRVGVHVRGTLDHPQLSLESEPPMPREQQLSWLLFGRSLDTNSSSDRSFVSAAAMSLGVTGGDLFASRIGKKIGLDELSIGADTAGGSAVSADPTRITGSQAAQGQYGSSAATQAAQLTLGKYLTPKLFISYGVSLFQPGQTFRLLYDLGHGFKLQTESGVASGGDLLYTFERGKK